MSIFPKKITYNENVIIHIKFSNSSQKPKYLYYETAVFNPIGSQVDCIHGGFLIAAGKEGYPGEKELYHSVRIRSDFLPGKYRTVTDLFYRGKKLHSLTEQNDFFMVEKVTHRIIRTSADEIDIEIINESNESTVLSFVSDNGREIPLKLAGKEKKQITLAKDFKYIKLGNKSLLPISDTSEIYVKNPKYSWTIQGSNIVIDHQTKQQMKLTNAESWIWLKCDGSINAENLITLSRMSYSAARDIIDKLVDQDLLIPLNRYGPIS